MSELDELITACECCRGLTSLTPATLANPAGLSSLAYRVGTHASFKDTMLARLSRFPTLRLTTRRDDDPTIALLDAWATVADVLTFYQERIANEGYLRTATERRSILELARTFGYELRPGVAASTYLAFTLDESPGSPQKVILPTGIRVQSLPGKEELPQTFETGKEIIARPEWNAMKARMTYPQYFNKDTRTFYFKGTKTNLKTGDVVLLRAGERHDPNNPGTIENVILQVVRVEPDNINQRTKVDLEESPPPPLQFIFPYPVCTQFSLVQQPFVAGSVANTFTYSTWRSSDLATFTHIHRWSTTNLRLHVEKTRKAPPPPPETGIFMFRVKTAAFGNNAPNWNTIPNEWKNTYTPQGPYTNWEDTSIRKKGDGTSYEDAVIYLESAFPAIQKDSWIVIKSTGSLAKDYQVEETGEESRADFGLSAKATKLKLYSSDGLTDFKLRETTIHAQSEKLELSDLPIEDKIEKDRVELDSMQLNLTVDQTVILTGERADLEGVVESEVAMLHDIVHKGGYTQLIFTKPLQHPYKRSTVTINANVAPATHGETKEEVLGSGDAAEPMQRFVLRQKPLTYVSAPVPSGALSTLQVRINRVLWHEEPDLYRLGPTDRAYIVRHDDEGKATVYFGDGVHGSRIRTGVENVTAKLRVGIGFAGNVEAGRISLLQTRPLGVKSATNPLPATGGAEPETLDDARQNAPLTVLTLDRIVSLKDFEDFARAFSGIGKASATWLWDGEGRVVHVTIAAANGDPVAPDSTLYKNLLEAMNRVRDPFQRLQLDSFLPLLFNLDAEVRVHPDYEDKKVLEEVEARLRAAFSFTTRAFGQSVALSEVMAVIQQVPGVEAVTVKHFYYSHETPPPQPQPRLLAAPAKLQPDGTIQPAQLLTITPAPISLSVMA